jgi:peptidase E
MTPMFAKIFQALGSPQPRVAYVGAASGDSWMFYRLLAGLFKAAGAPEVTRVLLAGRKADAAKARAQLREADVVFVSGGDVEEGMRWLQVHGLATFFQKLYAAGKPFFGVSAGSIMLGQRWVAWADPKDDGSAALFDCLGVVGLLCDTHAEGEGWEELQAAVRLLPGAGRGYGIPTGGILRVTPGGRPAALLKPCAVFARRGGRVVRLADLPAKKDL